MRAAPVLAKLGAAAALGGILAAAGLAVVLRRSLPRTEGKVRLTGLEGRVEVVRDRWGVPHIFAESPRDLFFAQGYVTAQDRLWQMEVNRRVATGELAEVLGRQALDVDRLVRRLGLLRVARSEASMLDGHTRAALESYCAGVNAFLVSGAALPVEFLLLRFRPRPWTPEECLAFGRFMAFALSPNWDSELLRARSIARLGREAAADLEPGTWQAAANALPRDVDFKVVDRLLDTFPPGLPAVAPASSSGVASNSWVVHGRRTTTGRPILANDPHLPPRLPALWYEVHLRGGGYDVMGASLPGTPGVLIGHNERIAWGVTAAMLDVQDFFLECFSPDGERYLYRDSWERPQRVTERIVVRGMDQPVLEEVLLTRHGPVMTPVVMEGGEYYALALRSAVLEEAPVANSLLRINRAGSWEEFRAALESWVTPPLNFVYADVDGHVGYQMAGWVPVRGGGKGLVPAPGWDGGYDWMGFIPFQRLPSALDPSTGFVATANHRIVEDASAHLLTGEWVDDYRHRRICQVISARERLSVEDMKALQNDVYSLAASELLEALGELHPADPLEAAALQWLLAWDRRLDVESVGACIYHELRRCLARRLYLPQAGDLLRHLMGDGLDRLLAPTGSYHYRLTSAMLARLRRLRSRADGGPGSHREEVLEEAFRDAVAGLRRRLGDDISRWRWGRVHTVTFRHALSVRRSLGRFFDQGPFPVGGDADTVCQMKGVPGPWQSAALVPSYRTILDLADWDRSLSVLPPGQSGHRASPHFADQISLWLDGRYHLMPYSRAAIDAHAESTLVLEKVTIL